MHRLARAILAALTALALMGGSQAQAQAQDNAPAGPAFNLDIRAPRNVRELLEKHMELRRYREVSDLDDSEIARLLSAAQRDVRELVGTLGYFAPTIAIRREQPAGARPVIVVEVEPGPPTQVTAVDIAFQGDIAQSTQREAVEQREAIREEWRLPIGRRFTQDDWNAAKSHAHTQLITRRYPRGRISYSLADVDAATSHASLGLRLDSGPLFHLGAMHVTGVEKYDPVLVPRLAVLPPGSIYDQDALTRAQLRLTGSGYFDSAFIHVDPDSDPAAAPVEVTVREAPLHRVVLGLGLSTDSGARASVEYRNNKVPVIGWRAVTKLQLERKSPFAETEWTAIPDEKGWRWGVLARAERLDDGQLVTRAQRLRVGRTWLGEHIERNMYLQYDRASVQASNGSLASIPDNGDGTALSANYLWTGRYFDRNPFPNRGFMVGAELGGGVTLSGSRSPFQRTVLRWLGIRPLDVGRLQMRAEAGAVFARSEARVPATQLFRTGGDTTVRGYGLREIGVERAGGVIAPGRYMATGSVEWQRPVRRNGVETAFESVLFVDGGAVADRAANLRPVFGAGVGARYRSPLGPIEADLAYGFKPKKFRLHFTIGTTF